MNLAGEEMTSASESAHGGYGYRPKLVWDSGVQEYLSQAYGRAEFAEMCHALTRPCITSTVRINTQQATTQEVMEQLRQHFQETSALNVGAANGQNLEQKSDVCRSRELPASCNRGPQEEFGKFSNDARVETPVGHNSRAVVKGIKRTGEDLMHDICWEHPVLKDVVMVRGRGPCPVDCGDERGEPILKEVVVSRKCAEAVLRGANVFVPGLLACSLHVEKGDEVAVTVAVERPDANGGWFVGITRGTIIASGHGKAQLEGCTRSDFFIGKGRVTMSRAALFKETQGVAIEMTDRVFDLPPFHGLLKGQIFLQNLPSIVAARVLDPRPGERILDMCAAPGGKTTAIAILMKDNGEIVALDRSHCKVLDIKRLAEEMMLTCIHAYKVDATKAVKKTLIIDKVPELPPQPLNHVVNPSEISQLASEIMAPTQPRDCSQDKKGAYVSQAAARKEARKIKNMSKRGQIGGNLQYIKGFRPQSFDRVLLDAPCSALGLRPRLFAAEETLESLRSHACYQRKMLDQAVQLVRPGGTLVYSTCTLNPGENEAVVRHALDTYDFLSLVPQEPRIGGPGLVGGLDVFDGMSYKEWLREEEKDLVQRFSPAGAYDTIGFFVAKFAVGQSDTSCAPSTLEE